MMSKTFHIEIEVDNIQDDEMGAAVEEALRIGARQAFGSIMLITGGNPPPKIVVWGEDFMNGTTKLNLNEEDE